MRTLVAVASLFTVVASCYAQALPSPPTAAFAEPGLQRPAPNAAREHEPTRRPDEKSSAAPVVSTPRDEEAAVRFLIRQEKAKIDGVKPTADWPQVIHHNSDGIWYVEVDTSRLPGGYPEQIAVRVFATGGHTGELKIRGRPTGR